MKTALFLSVFILISHCFIAPLYAQESMSATGGDISSTTGSISFTLGQPLYTTDSAADGQVFKGVQQPFEIFVVQIMQPWRDQFPVVSVFPNPASRHINIKTEVRSAGCTSGMHFALFDMGGKLVKQGTIQGVKLLWGFTSWPLHPIF